MCTWGTGTDLDTRRKRYYLSALALQRSEKVPACAMSGKRDEGIIRLLQKSPRGGL